MKFLIVPVILGLVGGFLIYENAHFFRDRQDGIVVFFTELRFNFDNFTLGQYYFNHGDKADGTYDIQKARYYFEQAVIENPHQHLLLWHQLGRIDFLEGKFNDAITKFEKQRELYGEKLPNVHYMLALTYGYQARNTGSHYAWHMAEQHFIEYLEYDPLSPWARVDLAWVHFAQGEYEDMIDVLEIGITHHPDNPWLLNMYGLALLNTGKHDKARQYFTWAEAEAEKLTVEEWGKSYPGNDPDIWGKGLGEFRSIIQANIALTEN